MKKNRIPAKVKIEKIDEETLIRIQPRDKTVFDIACWIFSLIFIIGSTSALIVDKASLFFVVAFSLIMIFAFSSVLISVLSLSEKAEIRITDKELFIMQSRFIFSVKRIIQLNRITYIDLSKVGINSEAFNWYVSFRSMFRLFDDYIPYVGIKNDVPIRIFQYHDLDIRKWIVGYLKKELAK